MTIAGSLGSISSLLLPVTVKAPASSPDSTSVAVTVATCTSSRFGGQSVQPAAGIPEMTGRVLSILIVRDRDASLFPAKSVAKQWIVVRPSETRWSDAVFPAASCAPLGCAPVTEYSTCFTIPPGLSCAFRLTVTSLLFQPFMLGAGVTFAVVCGGSVSRAANTARPLALELRFGLSDDELPTLPIPVPGSRIAKLVEPVTGIGR